MSDAKSGLPADVLNSIPEELRSVFQTGSIAKEARVDPFKYFEEIETFKKKVRTTSRLYAYMGEDIFQFMSPNGELRFELGFVDLIELREKIQYEQLLNEARLKFHSSLAPHPVEVMIKRNGEDFKVRIQYPAQEVTHRIYRDRSALQRIAHRPLPEGIMASVSKGSELEKHSRATAKDLLSIRIGKSEDAPTAVQMMQYFKEAIKKTAIAVVVDHRHFGYWVTR